MSVLAFVAWHSEAKKMFCVPFLDFMLYEQHTNQIIYVYL